MKKSTAKILSCACSIIGGLAFLLLIGIAGGIEQDTLTLRSGAIYGAVALSVLWVSVEVGNRAYYISGEDEHE